jgi:hypothetical protein
MLSEHMSLRLVIHDVWIIGIALQVLLAAVMLAKRTWQMYPMFTGYVFFNLFGAAIGYAVFGNKVVYFYTYFVCESIAIVLGLGVVREIFTNVFSPAPGFA